MTVYPLKFIPLFKPRIWGGRRLAQVFEKSLPPGVAIGESWELVDLPQDKSVVANGPFAEQTLAELCACQAKEIFGHTAHQGSFPLLIKLLDAQDTLSVQVHPDEAACERMGKGDPKTECWYIIEADPEAYIYKGLKPGVTQAMFAEAVARGRAESLLCRLPVHPGECHFLPAGTVHAIGPGLLIAEVQLPSDTTYRLYDFNRRDDQGKARELHIADGLESIHFDQDPETLAVTTVGRLVDCPYFKLDKHHLVSGGQALVGRRQMAVLVFLEGTGKFTGKFNEVSARAGDCLLIPAACEAVFECLQECTFLTITLGVEA